MKFVERTDRVVVRETFGAETDNPPELQQRGWQAILDNIRRHVKEGILVT